jgi:chorismate mutase
VTLREVSRHLVAILLALGLGCAATPGTSPARSPLRAGEPEAGAGRLMELMGERLALATFVARAKWNAHLPVQDAAREASQLADLRARAAARRLPPDWVEAFFRAQVEAGKQVQQRLIDRWTAANAPPFAGTPDLRAEIRPKIDALNREMLEVLVQLEPSLRAPAVQALFRPERLQSAEVGTDVAERALAPLLR